MADLQLKVPQQVKNRLRKALLLRRRRLRRQEHEVEIAEGRHLAAAGAAEADERDAGRRLFQDALGAEVVSDADELVVEKGSRLSDSAAIAGLRDETPSNFLAAGRQGIAENIGGIGGQSLAAGKFSKTFGQRPSIDDCALICDVVQAHGLRSAAIRLSL